MQRLAGDVPRKLKEALGKKAEKTRIMIIKENYVRVTQQVKHTESWVLLSLLS